MGWVPSAAWLTKVTIDAAAPQLDFDLAIDASGAAAPSRVMAGLDLPGTATTPTDTTDPRGLILGLTMLIGGVGGLVVLLLWRRPPLTMA